MVVGHFSNSSVSKRVLSSGKGSYKSCKASCFFRPVLSSLLYQLVGGQASKSVSKMDTTGLRVTRGLKYLKVIFERKDADK